MGHTGNTLSERTHFTDHLNSHSMQRIIILLLISAVTQTAFAQQSSCCSATVTFADFSKDIAFVNKHDEPVPFSYLSQKGKMETFQCQDSTTASAYIVQATEPSNKYLLVFHEWWGLNDYIRQTADQLYTDLNSKAHVIALDLYDGKVATTRDSAQKYMQTLSHDRAFMIIRSLTEKFGDDVEIASECSSSIFNYRFEGSWAFQITNSRAVQLQSQFGGSNLHRLG